MINESFANDSQEQKKYCPHCTSSKPYADFYKYKNGRLSCYCRECLRRLARIAKAQQPTELLDEGQLKATRKCLGCGETFAPSRTFWADDEKTICIGCVYDAQYEAESDRMRAKLERVQARIRGSAQVQAVIRAGKQVRE